ncbi:MAG: YkgJ family cysteine cluster protein [Chitinophagaceae bacterium]|nr:YkgJ family cysteine cluster protein [Chitinophagaceae bacterium]
MASNLLSSFKRALPHKRKELRAFLKKFDKKFIPGIKKYVDPADAETWAETDCLSCANCCKVMTPTFTKADLKRISAHLGMTESAFYDRWLETDKDNGDKVNRIQPCQFLDLKTNMCNIYEVRPEDCAKFPHFKRTPFADFNHIHTQNIEYCPATFKFITRMKEKIERDYEW